MGRVKLGNVLTSPTATRAAGYAAITAVLDAILGPAS